MIAETTRDDLDALLAFTMPFAERMLAKAGGFHPFAAVMTGRGEIEPVVELSDDDRPDPNELLGTLAEGIRARAATSVVRACALCADVRVVPPDATEEVDAVRVALEHVDDDECTTVFRPYVNARRGPRLGELFAVRSPREVLSGTG